MIEKYKFRIEKKIESFNWLYIEHQFQIDNISDEMTILKGRFIFLDYSILEFNELISNNENNYRFHYMGPTGTLIKRWDTAPHHPNISTHPYHIHESNKVIASEIMNLEKILDEISAYVTENISNE